MDQNNNNNSEYNFGYTDEAGKTSESYSGNNENYSGNGTGPEGQDNHNNTYQYNQGYNQSRNFTDDLKGHQYDGIIALFCGILGLLSNGLVGIVLCVISIVLGVKARKFPEQKTYGTIGIICAVIGLIKRAVILILFSTAFLPLIGHTMIGATDILFNL